MSLMTVGVKIWLCPSRSVLALTSAASWASWVAALFCCVIGAS